MLKVTPGAGRLPGRAPWRQSLSTCPHTEASCGHQPSQSHVCQRDLPGLGCALEPRRRQGEHPGRSVSERRRGRKEEAVNAEAVP